MAQHFEIPKSVRSYFGDKKIKLVVDSLLANLNGVSAGETRQEFLSYNQGLLLAVQFRTDMVETLFRIWEATFLHPDLIENQGLEEDFVYGEADIAEIIDELYVSSYFGKRSGTEDRDLFSTEIAIDDNKTLSIVSCHIDPENDVLSLGKSKSKEIMSAAGWRPSFKDEDGDQFYKMEICSWSDFLEDPNLYLEKMAAAGRAVFEARLLD